MAAGYRYFAFLILVALLCLQSSCNSEEREGVPGLPPITYKLIEHPNDLKTEGITLDEITGTATLGKETNRVVFMGNVVSLTFRIPLSESGKVDFAYGIGANAFKYASEIQLSGELKSGDQSIPLGEVKLNTRNTDATGKWFDAEWPFPKGTSGGYELVFTLSGVKEGAPNGIFLLAHPTVVNPLPGTNPHRFILIGVDTLRADHLGCYGYERPTSPNIDKFAADAALFERCISTCPWTFPSFGSMLTGKYPSIAGATTNVKFLGDDESTIAEGLSQLDFATFAVVNSPWVGRMTNMLQGFDTAIEFPNLRAGKSFDEAENWLEAHADEDCFVFIHLMDPHLPYRPKPENLGKFNPGYNGPYSEMFDMNHDDIERLRAGEIMMSDADKVQVEALYDEALFGLDQDFGKFIESLKADNLYDETMIILTGDHGEEFWEHGGFEHGHQLYDELLHVPLLVHGREFDAGRVNGLCSTIDIFPTILQSLGFSWDGINGELLQNLIGPTAASQWRHIISEQLYYGVEQKAVTTNQYRYILHTLDDSEELYDITDDPGMHSNVAEDRRSTTRDFRYLLKEYIFKTMGGWHIRFSDLPGNAHGKEYDVTVTAPGGFTQISDHGLQENDSVKVEGDALLIKISFDGSGEKFVAFSTPNEDTELKFDIIIDGEDNNFGLVFLGPDKEMNRSNHLSLKITDPRFGLGIPNFRQGKDAGVYIWANSKSLREELTPEIGDEVREELKSLGYLQ